MNTSLFSPFTLVKISELKTFKKFILFISFFLIVSASAYSQVVITTTVTWTTGWCNICGPTTGNYACNPPWSGSGTWNNGMRTFNVVIPPGNVITGACVTVNKVNCGYTNLCVNINGNILGCSAPNPPGNCGCGTCWPETFCANYPCPTGMPGFIYGGTNTVQLVNTGDICVESAVITLTYQMCCTQPTLTAAANPASVCPGSTSTLTAGGAGIGGTYTWTPGGMTGSTVTVNPLVTTIYTVAGTTTAGCVGTQTVQVTVNPLPTITAIPSPSAICIGQSANVAMSGAFSYTTNPGNIVGNNIIVSPTVTSIYTVTGTSGLGCIGTKTFQVIVNPLPVVNPGSNSPVCTGATLSLTVGAFNTYTWTGPNGFASNLQNPTIPNVNNLNGGVYTVSVTNANGCVNSGTVSVTITPPPVITPTNTGPYCAGAIINLSVTAFTTYTWTGPNGFSSNLQTPSIINGQVVNGGIYTVTVANINGCTATGTTNVIVNALPTPTAGSNSPVCVNQSITFTGNGGSTYTWTGPGGFSSNLQNPLIASAQASNSGVYTLSVTNGSGCVNSTTINVVVNPLPVIVVNNPLVCLNQNINLTASGGSTYSWSGPLGFTSLAQNPVIPNAQLSMSGAYTVTVTTAFGCTATAIANVTVIALPNPTITNNSPVCVGATLSFTGSGGSSYSWTGPNGFSSGIQNPNITNVSLAANGIYTLIVTAGTCTNVTTASVTINPLPTPTAVSNSPVCLLQPINFTGSGGTTYTWTGPGGFNSNAQNPVIAVAQASNAGTYSLTVSSVNGCTNTTTTPVIINPLPAIVVNNPLACLNTNLSLTATGGTAYAWSGPLGFVSNVQNPVIPNVQLNMTGAYTVIVTSAQGCTASAVSNATVINLPTAIILSNSPVCVGSILSFTGSGGVGYNWTGPNGFTSLVQNPGIVNVTLPASGIYTLVVTAGTCSNSTTANITINPLPVPTATSNSAVCKNQSINLTGGGGTTYTWTGPGGFNSNTQNPVIAVAQSSNAGTYTLTVSDVNNCTNSITTNVVVNPLPNVTTGNIVVCENTTINLFANGAVTYTWSGPNGFVSNLSTPSIPFAQVNMSGAYVVNGTSAQGCSNTAVANVTVIPLPTPAITNNTPCVGSALNLSGTGGISYSWTGPNSFTNTSQNPSIPTTSLINSGNYVLVVSAGNCTAMVTASITINPLPTPTITSNNPVCLMQPINFVASGGNNYTWTGPNGYTGNGNNPTIPSAGILNAGTYTAIATDVNNCTNTVVTTVSINLLPIIAVVGSTLCEQSTMSLTASGGTTYAWSGPGGFTASGPSALVTDATIGMSGQYTVSVTDANGCSSASVTNVQVNPIPTLTLSANTPVCINQTISLQASSATGIYYLWTGPNGFVSQQQNPSITNAQGNTAGFYTVTVTDNIGCSAKASVPMIVYPLPVVTVSSDKTKGCVPVCMTFSMISTSPLQNCLWQFGDGSSGSSIGAITKCYTKPGGFDITSKFVDVHGCANTSTFNVEAYPIPVADFNFEPSKPITNESIEFSDASRGANISGWTWNFSHIKNKVVLNSVTSLAFEDAGNYAVALIVMSDKGCRDTVVKSITVGDDFGIFVPDAFSPNDDGLNDIFQAKGFGIVKFEMNVFDRWGERLYTTTDFTQGWDGKKGGEAVKEDVYIWKIKLVNVFGKAKEVSGKVTVTK